MACSCNRTHCNCVQVSGYSSGFSGGKVGDFLPGFVLSTTDNKGWECPKCGRCFAPHVDECKYCQPVQFSFTTPQTGTSWYGTTGGTPKE